LRRAARLPIWLASDQRFFQLRARCFAATTMDDVTAKPVKLCPICGKQAETQFRPFCSKRCADVDLHRWLSGVYAVPAAEDDETADGDNGHAGDQADG
jgi:endogenous inhibitor of DNA gyrase (YacG/DUF329 family)